MAILYKITNTLNGKVYIGFSTETLDKRWKKHLYHAFAETHDGKYVNHHHFACAIRKYGKDVWKREVLLEEPDVLWANNITEPFLIAHYDSANPDKGYNTTLGGEGTILNEETRQFIVEKKRETNRPSPDHYTLNELVEQGLTKLPFEVLIGAASRGRLVTVKPGPYQYTTLQDLKEFEHYYNPPTPDHYLLSELVDQGLTKLTHQVLKTAAKYGSLVAVKHGRYRYTTLQDLRDFELKYISPYDGHRPLPDHFTLMELVDQGKTKLPLIVLQTAAKNRTLVTVKSGPFHYTTLKDLQDFELKYISPYDGHRPSRNHYTLMELVDQGLTKLTQQVLKHAAKRGSLVSVKSGPYRYTTLKDLRDYEAKYKGYKLRKSKKSPS